MAKFDFIEAASAGYRFVWRERHALWPFATIPLAAKIGSYAAITLFGLSENYLRQGLILLPSYFLEGMMVTVAIRMAVFNENFSRLFEGDRSAADNFPESRARAMMAGAVIYVLTKLVTSFLAGWTMIAQEVEKMPGMPEPSGSPYVISIMIMVFLIWTFRFFWLYVPAALGFSIRGFLDLIKPFAASVYIVGLWLLCSVPMMLIVIVCAKMLTVVFPVAEGVLSPVHTIVMGVVQSCVELFVALSSSVAMAFATMAMIKDAKRPPGRPPRRPR